MSPVANSIKQTVLNSHDKAEIQRKIKMVFAIKWRREGSDAWKGNSSPKKNSNALPFMFQFFLYLFPLFFVFCQKQLGLTLQAVTSRPSPASHKGGEFCSWMELQSSQTPNHRWHTWGVETEEKGRSKKSFLCLNQGLCPEDKPITAQWRKISMQKLNKHKMKWWRELEI